MLKKCMYLLVIIALVIMVGCAAGPTASAFLGGPQVEISGVNANSTREAQLSNTVLFGVLFADKTFPTVAETVRSGNITKIATVQFYTQKEMFGLMTKYTTIVTGE